MNKSKINSKYKKGPLSCLDKKTQYSNKNLPFDFPSKASESKSPIINPNNNEYLKESLTDRKLSKNLDNFSYKIFFKENNSLKIPHYLRNIETPKKIIYNHLFEKNIEDVEDLGLSEFIVINNESLMRKFDNTPKNIIKNNSGSRLTSASLYHDANLSNKNISNFKSKLNKNNSFNKQKNKSIYNNFYKYKKDYIKKRLLSNIARNKNNNDKNIINNTISLDIVKTNSITYNSLLNISSRTKNIPENDIIIKQKSENSENENICQNMKINDSETDCTKIKNKYLIKFAKVAEIYKKFSSNSDLIRVDFRNTFLNLLNNVFKSLEEYNKFILYKYKINYILSIDIWSNSLKAFYDFCGNVIKWQKMMIEEIRVLKKENIILNKKLFLTENDLNLKDKEIKNINDNIIKYDLNKVKSGKIAYEKVEKIKNNYINHESSYVLTIYQLENELRHLSDLLIKNKVDKKEFEELQRKFNITKDEYDKNKADYKEYEYQSEKKIMLLTQYNSELSQKIHNLENDLKITKDKENEYIEQIIVLKSKIEYSNKMINQKEINISQLKSEIKKLTDMKKARMLQPAKTVFVPCE